MNNVYLVIREKDSVLVSIMRNKEDMQGKKENGEVLDYFKVCE